MRRLLYPALPVLAALLTACAALPEAYLPSSTPAATATPTPIPLPTFSAAEEEAFTAQRLRLVEVGVIGLGINDPAVIEAMEKVPRHRFVPPSYVGRAYVNAPLPIGHGQSISQPYIVALMTEALRLRPTDRVLEIGTGSGYQAAILAEIAQEVYTIEIIKPLAHLAAARLAAMGYDNIEVRYGDGYFGWEEQAPFDAIIVTCAPDHVPPPLRSQLADGGRMVIPVGPPGGYQELWLIERHGDEFTTQSLGDVLFVPLTRELR